MAGDGPFTGHPGSLWAWLLACFLPFSWQMLDRYEYQEGRRSHLCCHLLFWMLRGTLSMPGLYSGHPVVLFLEHGIECEGNLWQASTATCTLCISAPGGELAKPRITQRCSLGCALCKECDSRWPRLWSWAERRLLWLGEPWNLALGPRHCSFLKEHQDAESQWTRCWSASSVVMRLDLFLFAYTELCINPWEF